MNRTECVDFVNDIVSFIDFVRENYSDKNEMELVIKNTLLHDILGILSRDEHFLPRVDGYSNLQHNVKELTKTK